MSSALLSATEMAMFVSLAVVEQSARTVRPCDERANAAHGGSTRPPRAQADYPVQGVRRARAGTFASDYFEAGVVRSRERLSYSCPSPWWRTSMRTSYGVDVGTGSTSTRPMPVVVLPPMITLFG